MSVAEKLIAQGRVEGRNEGRAEGQEKGLWIGKIQTLEEFLNQPVSPREALAAIDLAKLEARHRELHRAYELRFKPQ